MPDWAWTYCTEECWSSSQKAIMCLALGDKLAGLLGYHEIALLKEGVEESSHYLDKILEGIKLPRE